MGTSATSFEIRGVWAFRTRLTARLASLVNIGELLSTLAQLLPLECYEVDLQQALLAFNVRWYTATALPAPQKDLQKCLTDGVHQQRHDKMIGAAEGDKGNA